MGTHQLYRELRKMGFFKRYGNKDEMSCGRILADIEVDFELIGWVFISMLNAGTLELSFLNSSCAFDERHPVASFEDAIARIEAFISSPNIRH